MMFCSTHLEKAVDMWITLRGLRVTHIPTASTAAGLVAVLPSTPVL